MILYHRTYERNVKSILEEGFIDNTGCYMTAEEFSGVWFSNYPLDINEGAKGDSIFQIDFDFSIEELESFEWVEEDKPYREFLIPADIANNKIISIKLLEYDDEIIRSI